MNQNRKRVREDELCDLPLSKRINNLHLNNFASGHGQPQHQANSMLQATCPSPVAEKRPSYDPGIHCSQSNYFYNNKLLFELHLERLQRTGQQYPW